MANSVVELQRYSEQIQHMPGKSLTRVSSAGRDILVGEAPVMLVLPPESCETPRGFPFGDIIAFIDLMFQPSKPFNLGEWGESDQTGEALTGHT